MEIVKKTSNPEYKEDLKKKKIKQYSNLEDFVSSEGFKEWFKILNSTIESTSNNILLDESAEENEVKYSMKTLKIMLRKQLIHLRNEPLNKLKSLWISLNTLGRTE